MTRTVPTLLERIPVHNAAHMAANGGTHMQLPILIAAGCNLLEPAAIETAFTRAQLLDRGDLPAGEIFGHATQRRGVLAQEVAEILGYDATGDVGFLPSALAIDNQAGNHHRAKHAVGHALPRAAGN